ncbi:MAG: hypothetical protein KDK97_20010 [Verrucomicrobiales bacterium]|nr:hypothetical protein [Verrucomicrobiales bacterium]MCP5559347.1 hypothetical protein [Verrucomicrobiaceae bacterium]
MESDRTGISGSEGIEKGAVGPESSRLPVFGANAPNNSELDIPSLVFGDSGASNSGAAAGAAPQDVPEGEANGSNPADFPGAVGSGLAAGASGNLNVFGAAAAGASGKLNALDAGVAVGGGVCAPGKVNALGGGDAAGASGNLKALGSGVSTGGLGACGKLNEMGAGAAAGASGNLNALGCSAALATGTEGVEKRGDGGAAGAAIPAGACPAAAPNGNSNLAPAAGCTVACAGAVSGAGVPDPARSDVNDATLDANGAMMAGAFATGAAGCGS